MKDNNEWKKVANCFIFAVLLIIVYKVLDNFSSVQNFFANMFEILMPFFIGILIAYILYFPSRSIEKIFDKAKSKFIQKKSRGMAVFTTYLIAFLVILIIFNVVLPAVSKSIIDFANNMPELYGNIREYVANQPDESILKKIGAEEIIKSIEKIDIKGFFSTDNIINYVKSAIGFVNGVFSGFVAIIASVYILLERNKILSAVRKVAKAIFNQSTCESIEKYISKTNEVFYKFISSQVIDAIVVGTILSIAMLIMGVKYAILLGFIIGLLNIIPYFGAIIGVIIALVITLFTGGPTQTIWCAIVIIVLQQIDANIINPKIVGNSLTLSPLLVIFAVTVGGAYFGFFGMLLAVPVITVLKILVGDYIDYRSKNKTDK